MFVCLDKKKNTIFFICVHAPLCFLWLIKFYAFFILIQFEQFVRWCFFIDNCFYSVGLSSIIHILFSIRGYSSPDKQCFLSLLNKSVFLFEFNTSRTLQGILHLAASVEMNE